MLAVSDAYKELVKSNIRPKCEPIIRVSGKDNTGKDIEIIWKASNIKDLKYKRAIDPIGRELPYMELTWTEIYKGKLNAENYPEKYNNIIKNMQVELSFVQDLQFYNTWKSLFMGQKTWKDLFLKKATWKQVKNSATQEIIIFPKLYLTAKPTIKGQTITWVAKDFFSFMSGSEAKKFDGVLLKNLVSLFLVNARGSFRKSRKLFDAFTSSVENILSNENILEEFDKTIICDGEYKDILLNSLSVFNYYWDFKNDVAVIKKYNPLVVCGEFNGNTLYSYPQIENSTDISSYDFKNTIVEVDKEKGYYKEPYDVKQIASTEKGYLYALEYIFDEYGVAYETMPETEDDFLDFLQGDLNRVQKFAEWSDSGVLHDAVYVLPIVKNAYDNVISVDDIGEVFKENNPINPYGNGTVPAQKRKEFLQSYFSSSQVAMNFECLPNVSLETDDVILVETNLYDENDNRVFKKALIVDIELTYNGTLKQKIKAHEVII